MLRGDEIEVFVDRDDLSWGDEWRERIDEAHEETACFIPVVTPRYFARPECRRELLTFAGHAESLGVGELLLPVLYVDVPGLDEKSDDEAVALVARTEYEDWRELRLEDEDSHAYRKGVHRLAVRLAEISAQMASAEAPAAELEGSTIPEAAEEQPLGIVDILAEMEEAMPRWTAVVQGFPEVMSALSTAAEQAAHHIQLSDNAGKGFAGRLAAARNYAKAIEEPANRVLELGTKYASELVAVDPGVLTMIRLAGEQTSAEDKAAACDVFTSVRGLAAASAENVESLRTLSATIEETAKYSRDIRAPLAKVQSGLQRVMDGQSIMDEWVRQMDASPLDCSDVIM